MTYENLVKEAKKAVKTVDVKTIKEHLAVEFDIEGKGEGAFYVEFSSEKVEVEPYEYYDHDFRIRTDAANAIAILKGELDPVFAAGDGKIYVEGDFNKLETLKKHVAAATPEKKETKKATTKKAPAKKETVKKETAKKEPAKKETAKKEPAKKEATTKKATTAKATTAKATTAKATTAKATTAKAATTKAATKATTAKKTTK